MFLPTIIEIFSNATAIYASIAVVVLTFLCYGLKNKGLPPGPTGLPFLGYLPFLHPDTGYLQLQALGKKYGAVFSFTSTGRLYINLGSVKAMREALVTKSDCFQQRLDEPNLLQHYFNEGVLFLRGEPWKIVRKCISQLFRERGMTAIKDSLSGPMYDTIRSTVMDLKKKKGTPVDIAEILLLKGCTIMRQTLFGDDGMSDEELLEFNKGYGKLSANMNGVNILISGISFKYFYKVFSKGIKEVDEGMQTMKTLLMRAIKRRESTYDDSLVRDLIDGFIKERNTRRSKNDPNAKYFTEETTLQGYRIPKGSVLYYNFWMAHMNPDDYEEPEKFNPSRFITADRSKRPELPTTFGVGKRACIGESFSMTQVFLYLTTILKNFRLTKPVDAQDTPTISHLFNSYHICAHPRN